MRQLVLGLRMTIAVVILTVFCTAGIVAVLLGMRREKALRMVLPTWARLNLIACSLDVQILRGAEHLDAHRPCIYIANHQGLLDAFVFPTLLDKPMFYPIKKEMVYIPFIGWFAWMTRQPRIDRSDHFQAMLAMEKSTELLRNGLCTLLFPEGTRSRDGKLGSFKKGAFRMSMDTGVPLIPITLIDCGDHLPMGTYHLTPGTIHVVVDPPIYTTDWNRRNLAQKMEEVRNRLLANITEERAKLGLPPTD
ncbi:MAG: 1-acyl-sn-glycerol-3-phosphate acyltransferase [Candidatus Wallbacteria bacterium]|nr:1-acyl-sn-glycerol-3-phosphate acyltransferase [Candidatus Wallbacteria bacterium]